MIKKLYAQQMREIQDKYQGSILQQSTRLSKACGAWYHRDYWKGKANHITQCGTSPIYTNMIIPYWEQLQQQNG